MTLFWRAAPVVFLILWSGGYGFAKLGLEFAEPMTFLAMKQGMNAGTTAIIMALQPAVVATAAPLIGGKRGGGLLWLGLGIGFCGVLLAVMAEGSLGPSPLRAVLLALGALGGISGATLFEKAQGCKTDPIAGGLVQYAVGFTLLAPVAMATESLTVDWQPGLIVALVWLVLGNSLISISLYVAMLARGNATRISALMYLVPPLAMVTAWALLGEPLRVLALAGLALSALGGYIVIRQTR